MSREWLIVGYRNISIVDSHILIHISIFSLHHYLYDFYLPIFSTFFNLRRKSKMPTKFIILVYNPIGCCGMNKFFTTNLYL
jgi:hypothetical protein